MKYQNTKTGFVFETPCELSGEDWVKMPSPSSVVKEKEEKKPVRAKKEKKDE